MSDVTSEDMLRLTVAVVVVFEAIKLYEHTAPPMSTCRAASDDTSTDENNDVARQIKDADMTIGLAALIVAGAFSYHIKRIFPLLLVAASITLLSLSRRVVLSAAPTTRPR